MLRFSINRIIQELKHDPNYQLDTAINGRTMLQILKDRGVRILRGIWHCLWLSECHLPLFVGAHVKMRCPQMISIGQSVTIEDCVIIDALSHHGVRLGDNVKIAEFSMIQCTGVIRRLGAGITMGNNSAIGAYSFLGAQGGIRIGNNVIIGPRVNLHSENHICQDLNTPIQLQGEMRQGIVIEDNCWIGAGSIILDGVHIHSGCVVAAGSVVTRDVAPNSIVAGVPARIIKRRGDQQ